MRRLLLLTALMVAVTAFAAPSASAGFGSVLITASPAGTGSGLVTGPGIACSYAGGVTSGDCAEVLPAGLQVTLTATPGATSAITSLSGCPAPLFANGGSASCRFITTPTSPDVNLGVTFTFAPFTLSVTKDGTGGGTVVSNPLGISCGLFCQAHYPSGILVQLTATPDATSRFVAWGGACTPFGSNRVCIVQMNGDRTVSATFATNLVPVTVALAGSGTGRVTGGPGNYYCQPTCTAQIVLGTVMTFTASPAPGSLFGGWSAPCAGTSTTCTFTVTGATTLTATFNPAPVEATVTRVQTFRRPYRYTRVIAEADQAVSVALRIVRNGKTIGSRTVPTMKGRRTIAVDIAPGAASGPATLTVEFTNAYDRTKTQTFEVTIPRR